jgi:hypothetical protein
MRAFSYLATFAACCLLLSACSSGPPPLKIKVVLLNNGQPYKGDPKGTMLLVFIPVVEEKKAYSKYPAKLNRQDSSFFVDGLTGEGIPPGKYKVTFMQMVSGEPRREILEMNERFNEANTTISRDITSDAPLTIDLAKPEEQ